MIQPSRKFDWLFVVLSAWFVGGLFLDGWAHHHLDSTLETFFTPWHAVMYSGFFVSAFALGLWWFRNVRKGHSWNNAVPREYNLSLVGVLIFLGGGVFDIIWHTFIGIEVSVEALISPAHLILALGVALMVGGPMRSLFYSRKIEDGNFFNHLPLLASALFVMLTISFMAQFVHPVVHPFILQSLKTDRIFHGQALGIVNVIVQTVIFMGLILTLVRRMKMPFGSFTFFFALPVFAFGFMEDHYQFLLPAFVAGILTDVLFLWAHPWLHMMRYFRLFAFCVPFLLYLSYVFGALLSEGTWWSPHMWTGAFVISGIVGWLLSYLVMPPDSSERLSGA